MDIFGYFATILARLTNRDPLICKGLLRLSFKMQNKNTYPPITFNSLRETFHGQLKNRLEILKIPDSDRIIKILDTELTQIQSIITVGQI